jgi:hypothetical protein
MKGITRERPKMDRITCPWLTARFIGRTPEFLYVPAGQGRKCWRWRPRPARCPTTCPTLRCRTRAGCAASIRSCGKYRLAQPALHQLALIVRGADTSRLDLTPQLASLAAISPGLPKMFVDEHEMLAHELVIYNAPYGWCVSRQAETYRWPPGG